MRIIVLRLILSILTVPIFTKAARAYDMDCAIMLCMAGGFPTSAVCSAAYAEMIRRITPWPVRPPFGICTYTAMPVQLGGPGGNEDLDISTPDFGWLRRTRVLWFRGTSYKDDSEPRKWDWSIHSCDHENDNCSVLFQINRSRTPWPVDFVSENGQSISYPEADGRPGSFLRAVMIEFGDHAGEMDHSAWFVY